MDNWIAFYIGMGIFAIVGIASGIFANRINKGVAGLEHLASGKVTDHHHFVPFD